MSIRRLALLTGKEIVHGSRGFIIIAVVGPIVISLLFSLVFGTLFSGTPRLGMVDEGRSRMAELARGLSSVTVTVYPDSAALRRAVESGSVDMGVIIPEGLDRSMSAGERSVITAFVWGESLARNRIILGAVIAGLARDSAGELAGGKPGGGEGSGAEPGLSVDTVVLGDRRTAPWSDRLLPLIVLIAIFLGGIFLPASSVIKEKEKMTLQALTATPATVGEVFTSKGIVGGAVCFLMGMAILALNRAFGSSPVTLMIILGLGAVMAVVAGLMLGAVLKDVATLFAFWKSGGIVLFAPAIVYMFPAIPQWIGRLFPTYYLLQPITEISQRAGGWAEISLDVFILIAIDAALVALLALTLRRARQRTQTI